MRFLWSVRAWCGLVLVSATSLLGQPRITDFSPQIGGPGDTVTLYGNGFSSVGISVYFWNNAGVTTGYVNSDTVMTVVVPNGISTGPIAIQQNSGTPVYTSGDFQAIGPGPYITGFVPAYGKVNDTVVISGAHFMNPTLVVFSGTNAQYAAPNSAGDLITVTVPPGAISGPITAATPLGTNTSSDSFLVLGAGPYITGFLPFSGNVGQKVDVYGLQFTGATNATFNGQPGNSFVVLSDTHASVLVPSGASTGPIAVNGPLGGSATSSNFFLPPIIASASVLTGRAGTNVVLIGSNFLGATAVSMNALAASFTAVNNTNLQVTVPVGATTGLIRVTTPAFSGFFSSNFVVQPTIFGFAPVSGNIGSNIVISGANFNVGTPAVSFSGVPATTVSGVSFGQLTAVVPTGATTGPISITTPDGSDTNANNFFLPPSLLSLSSSNSLPGVRVVVTGRNLVGATAINFNGIPASSFTVSNNTTLGVVVPPGVTTGPVTVVTPGGTATSSTLFYAAPVIVDFVPKHGLPGTNVTVLGTNFLGTSSVLFSGQSAVVRSISNGQIVVTVPSGARSGPITVIAPAGTNNSVADFTLDYSSELQVAITGSPNPVSVSSNLVYSITLQNKGPFDAPNARFTNTLPNSVLLVGAVAAPGWTIVTNGNPVTGSTTNFPSGASATIILTALPQIQGSLTDTVMVASDNADPALSNNLASVTTEVDPLLLLSIRHATNQVRISWPAVFTNYSLQYQPVLGATGLWSAVTSPPSVLGLQRYVVEPDSAAARYYRLHK